MNARTQSFVLLLFGAALLRLASGDLLLRFVRPSARLWVLLAGGAFVALAVWSLVVDARSESPEPGGREPGTGDDARVRGGEFPGERRPGDEAHGAGVDAHGHRVATRVAWLVVAPVLAILVVVPQALGAFTADRQRSAVAAESLSAQTYPALPAGDPVTVTPFDFVTRAVLGSATTLRGRTVRMVGFVARGGSGDFTLARLVITCCAADASPVFVQVRDGGASGAAVRNAWVEVTGTYDGLSTTDQDVPVLRAVAVRAVVAPANPYD